MMWEQIASGTRDDLATGLREYDPQIPEGSRGYLKLHTSTPIHIGIVRSVEAALTAAGIPDVNVTYNNRALNIYWKKGFPWLIAIVGVVLPLLLILAIVLTTWQLFREAPDLVLPVLGTVSTIAIGVGLAAVAAIILLTRRK